MSYIYIIYPMHFFKSYSVCVCVCLFVCVFLLRCMSGIMSASKSSLGIRLALEDAASPESPFGTAMAMAHQVARQISGSKLASHKDLQKRIKPNRLGYMKVCSRRLVLEIIFTWARKHRQTPKCAIMIFSVAPGCMSSRTFSDDNTCIANSVAVPMYPRLTPADSSRQEMTLPIHGTFEAMSPQRWREFHCFSAPWHIHPWFLNKKDFTRFGLLTEILKLP